MLEGAAASHEQEQELQHCFKAAAQGGLRRLSLPPLDASSVVQRGHQADVTLDTIGISVHQNQPNVIVRVRPQNDTELCKYIQTYT